MACPFFPDARTLTVGTEFDLINASSTVIPVKLNGGSLVHLLYPQLDTKLVVTDIATTDGTWYDVMDGYNSSKRMHLFDDFISSGITSGTIGELPWTLVTAAGHTVSYFTSTASEAGVIVLGTGTGISAGGGLHLGNTSNVVGTGLMVMEWRVRFPMLSVAGQRYEAYMGLNNTITATAETATGIYFAYQEVSSPNFTFKASNANVRTTVNSGVAVVANTWYKLTLVVNAAGTQVDGYINGNFIGSITTNIPTAALAPVIISQKTVGTTNISYHLDFAKFMKNWTTPR